MAKRKRTTGDSAEAGVIVKGGASAPKKAKAPASGSKASSSPKLPGGTVTVQIVAGSYDRVLHGVQATVRTGQDGSDKTSFADTFLFDAHDSAIRCLALSPPSAPTSSSQHQKVTLATGATDNMIQLYNLSAHPPPSTRRKGPSGTRKNGSKSEDNNNGGDEDDGIDRELSTLTGRAVREDMRNRKLGTLQTLHQCAVTRLAFPTRAKLLSASEDSTVAVTRTRDWATLSTIKAPIPHVQGRPSGDTAPLGSVPSGINDFAIHPSMKVMISVSKGEKCMRLWNLVTGKKAGVLNYPRDVLAAIGEGRHSTGEGRQIVWGSSDEEDGGNEFAISFDRDVLVFGMDGTPRCHVMPDVRRKVHKIDYVKLDDGTDDESLLAVSTEDGRIMFFSTRRDHLTAPAAAPEASEDKHPRRQHAPAALPRAKLVAQIGGKEAGVTTRVKDFTVLPVDDRQGDKTWLIVTAGSDGRMRIWKTSRKSLTAAVAGDGDDAVTQRQAGELLGTYETQNRITCMSAFVMIPGPEEEGEEYDDLAFDELESEVEGQSEDEDEEA